VKYQKMKELTLLFKQGGITMYVLVFCSVLVIAVLFERLYIFQRFKVGLRKFINNLKNVITQKDTAESPQYISSPSWLASLIKFEPEAEAPDIERLQAANTTRVATYLERNLSILATVGSTAPFIGLFGTVLGIMRAFHAISVQRAAGIAVVGAGIAEALVCTAAGLGVAIVAVVAFNFFRTQTKRILDEFDVDQTELFIMVQRKQKIKETKD